MRLTELLRGAAAPSPARRRRRRAAGSARADAPRTIVPVDGAPAAPVPAPGEPFELRLDAARERLRRAIPPVADDAGE